MNDEGTNKNMLCFFDSARIHEEECRDARVEDVRTSINMALALTRTGRA